jgi:hypothetical protein
VRTVPWGNGISAFSLRSCSVRGEVADEKRDQEIFRGISRIRRYAAGGSVTEELRRRVGVETYTAEATVEP